MVEEDSTDVRHSGSPAGRWRRRRRSGGETVLITSAKRSPLADWRHRRTVYAALQLSRIPLFIAAVAVYALLHNPALAAFIAVISLPLPWIAVLLANEPGDDREKGAPKVYKPALVREQRARELQALEARRAGELTDGTADTPEIIDATDIPTDDREDTPDDSTPTDHGGSRDPGTR